MPPDTLLGESLLMDTSATVFPNEGGPIIPSHTRNKTPLIDEYNTNDLIYGSKKSREVYDYKQGKQLKIRQSRKSAFLTATVNKLRAAGRIATSSSPKSDYRH